MEPTSTEQILQVSLYRHNPGPEYNVTSWGRPWGIVPSLQILVTGV